MANLRANRITSTEVFETTGSVQFGNDNALKISTNSDFDLTSNDFTIECWIYMNSVESFQTIIMYTVDGTEDDTSFQFDITSTQLRFVAYVSNSSVVKGSNFSFAPGTWYHVAATRTNDLIRLFVDGDLIGTHGFTDTIDTEASAELNIGYRNNNGTIDREVFGHLSNLRIIKGTALYTTNFTPPTRELEVIPNTVLLCAQSKTQANREATGKTITVNGNAVANELTPGLLTNVVKSGGSSAITGSVEFDGTSDYLAVTNSNDFDFDAAITIEGFVYFSDLTGSPVVFARGGGNTGSSWNTTDGAQFAIYGTSTGRISFEYNSSGTPIQIISATGTLSANSWNHIAVTYDGTTFTLYLNGINVGTASNTPTMPTTRSNIWIGMWPTTALVQDMKGFISNLRIIKGTALYTSNFIPPTRKLTKLPGTVLLCCQDNESVTTEVTGKTITANGDPTASDFTPSVGSDDSVEFAGPTTINTENYFYLPTGNTESRTLNVATQASSSARGLFGGAYNYGVPSASRDTSNVIDYVTIPSTGNAIDFGDLTESRGPGGACASPTRGVWMGGDKTTSPYRSNTIDYVTISSKGNAQDFGDTILPHGHNGGVLSDSTRGISGGGNDPAVSPAVVNSIEYITIASTGNGQDFGDLTIAKYGVGGVASPSRGVFSAGDAGPAFTNTMDYITIQSMGNAIDFGDGITNTSGVGAASNSIRGLFAQGITSPYERIDYITIASTGNALEFGNLTTSHYARFKAGAASPTRIIFAGGYANPDGPGRTDMDFVTIMTTGNATDFGDLTTGRGMSGGCSNGHGGLG